MPQWIFLLVIVIVVWLALSVVGGLLVGRLIGFVERRVPHPGRRRRHATGSDRLRPVPIIESWRLISIPSRRSRHWKKSAAG
jgi:hypothetical protein